MLEKIKKIVKIDKRFFIRMVKIKIRKCRFRLFDKYFFCSTGRNVYIGKSILITPKYISIGSDVSIWENCRIEGIFKYNSIEFNPKIEISNKVSIQQNLHLTCANSIFIGKDTAIAANVTITDINHPYKDITKPVEKQDIEVKSVYIGENCKIYNNSVILPGVKIGKHCIVAANSVVNKNIPDYCVVAGSPARIIKRFNKTLKKWEATIES